MPGGPPVSPGQSTSPRLPDFETEIVLVAVLGIEYGDSRMRIVDVRREANDLFVKLHIDDSANPTDSAGGRADAVIVNRADLPPLDRLQVHFVNEFYEAMGRVETSR